MPSRLRDVELLAERCGQGIQSGLEDALLEPGCGLGGGRRTDPGGDPHVVRSLPDPPGRVGLLDDGKSLIFETVDGFRH